MISAVKEYFSPSKEKAGGDRNDSNGNASIMAENGISSSSPSHASPPPPPPSETTSLLGHPDNNNNNNHTTDTTRRQLFSDNDDVVVVKGRVESPPPLPRPQQTTSFLCTVCDDHDGDNDPVHPLLTQSPSVYEFYFDKSRNPTVQRYYRFEATPITPIVALHKQPGGGGTVVSGGGVTGLLRRSAVVPSHGTNPTTTPNGGINGNGNNNGNGGDWILVSVGGRSGWARKKQPHQHFSGFTLVTSFRATEGWMGNHAFFGIWRHGQCMLGSDAPSLVFTNILVLVGYIWQFGVVLPKLHDMEVTAAEKGTLPWPLGGWWWFGSASNNNNNDDNYYYSSSSSSSHTPVSDTLFWWSLSLGLLSVVTLWISALMDPGIIPPVSSPIKAPVPEGVPLGGPLGYRYCSTCNIFRPPRSKHCNSCNVCVSKFDQ